MQRLNRVRAMLAALAVGACFAAAPTGASAYVGNWNGNNDCPVDDPAMLASPAGDYTACVSFFGGGPWQLGNLSLRGGLNNQFGVYGPDSANPTLVPSTAATARGAGDLSPGGVTISGTELATECSLLASVQPRSPSSPYQFCLALARQADVGTLLTPYIEWAGPPADFHLTGVTGTGPVLTAPVKIRLQSPALGPDCYIGSDADPIRLHLESGAPPSYHLSSADPNGFPVTFDDWSFGGDLTDTSFAVPAASGCGSAIMDAVLNLAFGLPSGSGSNSVSIGREFDLESTTAGGSVLSQAFHTALGY